MMDTIPLNREFDCLQFINEEMERINLILAQAGGGEDYDTMEQTPTLNFKTTGNIKGELDASVARARAGLPLSPTSRTCRQA